MNEPTSDNQNPSMLQRPDQLLEGEGAAAWQAYNAMETTKRRHFELLEVIDNRLKNYNIKPGEVEQQLLACLLRDHDEQVRRFTQASQALKTLDAAAHRALFSYIGSINQASDSYRVTH